MMRDSRNSLIVLNLVLALSGTIACSLEATDDPGQEGEALADAETLKAVADTFSIEFGYANTFFVACDPNVPGEFVTVQGAFHGHVHETIDPQGRYHFNIQFRPFNVTGTGQTSGTVYSLRGATNNQFSGEGAAEFSFVNDFKLIGPGPHNDLTVHIPSEFGVSETGVLDPFVGGGTAECK